MRRVMAILWLLPLFLAAAAVGVVLQSCAQPDIKGFITIDCGGDTSYVANDTGLWTAADVGFTDTGSNHNISFECVYPTLHKIWYTVRSFPTGTRNCYTLCSLRPRLKYLIQARFEYGNYDGIGNQPIFDLHIGINFWMTMNISDPGYGYFTEAIVIVPDESLQVCLINTGTGTPFISGLDLRPLGNTLYPQANATHDLVLFGRANFGPTDSKEIRYPDDPHDRWWDSWVDTTNWASISTKMDVDYSYDDQYEVLTSVMQTAITPRNASKNIELSWHAESQPDNPMPRYIIIMHFAEVQHLPRWCN